MKKALQYLREALSAHYPGSEIQAMGYLLSETLYGIRKLDFCLGKDRVLSAHERQEWANIVERLACHEPIQYILGEAWFDGLRFEVDRHTLIPRPETAGLVEWVAADQATRPSPFGLLDIGTGSGCVAIGLALRLPRARVEAWDIEEGALAVARRNNERLGAGVRFARRDILHTPPQAAAYDVVVSNPPYIAESEKAGMDANVLEWEPPTALFVPDSDPLRFYRHIARFARTALRPGGQLYFEINRAYGTPLTELLDALGYRHIELRKDYVGNDRMLKATL